MSHLITGSGYLNNPVRTLLIADDNRPGSYPTQVSPIIAAKSEQFTKPYRDNIVPDTRVVYGRARVTFNDIPRTETSVSLTNALSANHTFFFSSEALPVISTTANRHAVNLFGINRERTLYDPGLSTSQVLTKRVAERFISTVNSATASLITASPTENYNTVLLTQNVPGTSGNTTVTTNSPAIVVENFTGGNAGEVRYPYGINVNSALELLQRVHSTNVTGTLSVPTSGKAHRLNAYSDQHPYGVFQPYDETGTHQAFGIATDFTGSQTYGTKTGLGDNFFTRGSVSGSLDEPLWVKDKLVVDLNPIEETSLVLSGGYPNFTMAYFGFDSKKWEPIGLGSGSIGPLPPTTIKNLLDTQYIGFSPSNLITHVNSSIVSNLEIYDDQIRSTFTKKKNIFTETGWLTPIDTFGFPLHPKYHATGSQQLSVDNLIEHPFLVEKIVYEFSASMPNALATLSFGGYYGGGFSFFILNQRKANPDPGQEGSYTTFNVRQTNAPGAVYKTQLEGGTNGPGGDYFNLNYDNGGIPQVLKLSEGSSPVYVNTVRDLVTFARVGIVWPTYKHEIENYFEKGFVDPSNFMDLAIEAPVSGTINPSGSYAVAADVKIPAQVTALGSFQVPAILGYVNPNQVVSIYSARLSSTRNSLDIPTGRSNTEFFGPTVPYSFNRSVSPTFGVKVDSTPAPYLIMPGDKLVFGVQCGTTKQMGPGGSGLDSNELLKLLPGAGKLTLYGSYLRDDKPVHDIYKDQLNSDAVHEAIPSGPWVLDRFESEPTMVYSSSMREEHVTGTMVTRGADGKLVVTNVNDESNGGVRIVRARASDGNLQFRYSFFRNSRLIDEEEQYYDSMQPNPLLALKKSDPDYGIIYDPSYNTSYIGFMIPGERFWLALGTTAFHNEIEKRCVKNWIGTFPFERIYGDTARVKVINSKTLTGTPISGSDFGTPATTVFPIPLDTGFLYFTGSQNYPGPSTFSNMSARGGITKYGWTDVNGSGVGTARIAVTSPEYDTNPIADEDYGTPTAKPQVTQLDYQKNTEINYHISRLFGCFGEGYKGLMQYHEDTYSNLTEGGVRGQIYRGTKHGLINPTPLFSSAVFSGTKFGQFRDMMEQRHYTRFSLANDTITVGAVGVQFVDRIAPPGIYTVVSGSDTNSSNISTFATSEHPYDDSLSDYDLIWDRQTPLPETLISL